MINKTKEGEMDAIYALGTWFVLWLFYRNGNLSEKTYRKWRLYMIILAIAMIAIEVVLFMAEGQV